MMADKVDYLVTENKSKGNIWIFLLAHKGVNALFMKPSHTACVLSLLNIAYF
jgi:hypothetical protein